MATSTVSSTTLVKEWSSPQRRIVQGQPPGPEVKNKETSKAEFRRQDIRLVTPVYKGQTEQTTTTTSAPYMNGTLKSGYTLKNESKIDSQQFQGVPDYKVETETEQYRLRIIDPKIESHSTIPVTSQTLPSAYRKRNKFDLFPSSHSKRSFMKLDPLEQPGQRTRVRSTDLRPITPVEYLSESIERHRQLEQSKLKAELKVKEREVNQPWDKPDRPLPKLKDPEPLREVNVKTHYESRTLNGGYGQGSLLMTPVNHRRRSRYDSSVSDDDLDGSDLFTASDSEVLVINARMKRHRQHIKPSPLHLSLTDDLDEEQIDSLQLQRSQSAPPHESPTVEILNISVSEIKDAYERQLIEDEMKKVRSTSVLVSPPIEEIREELTVPSEVLIPSASSMTSGMSRIAAWHDQSLINLSEVKSSDTVTKNRPVTPHPQKESVKMSNVVNKQSSQQLSANVFSTTSHQQSKKSSSVETTMRSYQQQNQFLSSEETEYERQIRMASGTFGQLDINKSSVANGKLPLSYPLDYRDETEFRIPPKPATKPPSYLYETPLPPHKPLEFSEEQEVFENKPVRKHIDASFDQSQHDLIATNVAELKGKFDQRQPQSASIPPKPLVKSWQKPQAIPNWEPLTERSTFPKQVTFENVRKEQQRYEEESGNDQVISWPPPPPAETYKSAPKTRFPSAPFDGPPYPVKLTPIPPSQLSPPQLSSYQQRPYGQQANLTPLVNQFGQVYFDNSTPMMPPRQPPYLERERMASKPEFAEQPQRKKPAEKPKKEPSYEDSQYSYEPKNLTKPTRKVDINYQQQSFDNSTFAFPQPVTKRQEFYQEENQDDYTSASGNNTWRRTYVLPNERPGLVKNRITTSSEILAEELPYGPDVSAIKSAFIPKPESKPQIQRVGRRWQPPPEEPPILPRRRNPLYSPTPADDAFHLWQPHLRQPEYKYERKNFTPPNSPVLDYQQKTTTPSHNKTRSIEHTDDFNWTNFETPRQQQRQRYSRDNSTDMEDNSSLDVRMRVVQPNLNQQRNVTSSTLQSNRSHLVSTPVQTDDNSPLTRGKRTQDSIIPRGLIDDSSLIRGRRPSQDSLHSSKSAPESQRRREYFSLGNEPTDRHPSTVTNRDRLKIDISRRIRLYEPSLKQQNKSAAPARTAKRPTSTVSVDEDTSDVDSRLSDRAVRFADRSNVLLHKLNQPVDMYFREDGSQLELTAGPYKQSLPLKEERNNSRKPPSGRSSVVAQKQQYFH